MQKRLEDSPSYHYLRPEAYACWLRPILTCVFFGIIFALLFWIGKEIYVPITRELKTPGKSPDLHSFLVLPASSVIIKQSTSHNVQKNNTDWIFSKPLIFVCNTVLLQLDKTMSWVQKIYSCFMENSAKISIKINNFKKNVVPNGLKIRRCMYDRVWCMSHLHFHSLTLCSRLMRP